MSKKQLRSDILDLVRMGLVIAVKATPEPVFVHAKHATRDQLAGQMSVTELKALFAEQNRRDAAPGN